MLAKRHFVAGILLTATVSAVGGCGEFFLNQTASLGGEVAGGRGAFRVLFINNTPYRAVFTYGSYDQTDQFSAPDFAQFGLRDSARNLEGNQASSVAPGESESHIACGRVFGIGSPELLTLIEENRPDAEVMEEALVEGVEFFEIDEEEDAAEPVSVGAAPPFEALLGADFLCGDLLIIRLEFDELGPAPFRVDFEMIPSESAR